MYGPTRGERREVKRQKSREQMDKGKKLKLLDQLILRRAKEAEARLVALLGMTKR